MTQSQQQIIDSIKLEFEKINSKKSHGGNLIDIDGIMGDIEKDKNTIEEIRLNNEWHKSILSEKILADVEILNKDLLKIGLFAYKKDFDIYINRNKFKYDGICISYNMSYVYKSLTNDITYMFYTGFKCVSSYVENENRKKEYKDLQGIASSNGFKAAVRKLYESSLKSL